ncbi:protein MraZ [Rodentibacter pneumotropicus]|nr:protein MraZ [Rodentibacter pneumotropicus]
MLVGQLNKFEIWSDTEWIAQIDEDIAVAGTAEFATDTNLNMLSF